MSSIDFPIIGIGASAGGLEPLERFFENVSNDAGFAYLIIQHLAPHHKSMMDELLARHTSLPITVMQDGLEIKPNHIYLNPPQKFVSLEGSYIRLNDKADRQLSYPITGFFHSLADEWEDQACAVILSGTGSDGSEGIKFIKEKGGLVLVQDPSSAKFDGMPKNAIASGSVDVICEPEAMPLEVNRFFNTREQLLNNESEEEQHDGILQIINIVNNTTGIDFSGYKYSTVSRRINKKMTVAGFRDLREYIGFLKTSPTEAALISKELLIGVTRFFRDEESFKVLREKVIPELVRNNAESRVLRIWVTACSTGEEAYSIAILVKDYLRTNQLQYDVTIFATDLDKEAIRAAGNRIFPESISTEITQDILQTYFIPGNKGYRIAKEIRDMVIFSVHNLIQDPPFSKIDLLTCRNFLIYLKPEVQKHVFSTFRYTLRANGFLFLGNSESLGQMVDHFEEYDKKNKIYLNSGGAGIPSNNLKRTNKQTVRLNLQGEYNRSGFEGANPLQNGLSRRALDGIQKFLIRQFAPDSLIFNHRFELIHTAGNVNEWLKLPSGEPTLNVTKMLPGDWSIFFETAARKTIHTKEPTILENLVVPARLVSENIFPSHIHILFSPVAIEETSERLIVATFQKTAGIQSNEEFAKIDLNIETRERLDLLEHELRANQQRLQTTIEELESSNEELQAANEELQSSNEELESVNEELYTVNSEYQAKVEELESSTNDFKNLLISTDIAILFLDEGLNIRRFTPAIGKIFNLLPQDVGRHIVHYRGKFQLDNFIDEVENVHKLLTPFETVIDNINDQSFIMRISPFRTEREEIKGIVISFTNITNYTALNRKYEFSQTELRNINEKYKEQSDLFDLIATSANDLISVNLPDGSLEYISPSLQDLTGYQPEDFITKMPFEWIHPDDKEQVIQTFQNAITGQDVRLLEFRIRTITGNYIWVENGMRSIYSKDGSVIKILNTARNINQRKSHESELKKFSTIAEQTTNGLIITDKFGYITFVNAGFEKITGYLEEDVLGTTPGAVLQGKDSDPAVIEKMREAVIKKEVFDVEIINYDKDGTKFWQKIHCEPTFDKHGIHTGFFALQTEISRQKEYESQIEKLNNLLKNQNRKLETANKSLEEFAYLASHDLKEPLRMVSGFMSLLDAKYAPQLDDKAKLYIAHARDGALRMNKLIAELLSYSQIGFNKNTYESVDTNQLLHELLTLHKDSIQEKKAIVTVQPLPTLFAARIPLKIVFQNLLTNALKYQAPTVIPEVDISAEATEEAWSFAVRDNGIGVDKEHQEKIFQLFRRLHRVDEYEGTGMGLATCKKIIESHGGQIWIESEPGQGSTFLFTIPIKLPA